MITDVVGMVRSMTGYGRNIVSIDNTSITVEIRSVNHRFLDFTAKIPRAFLYLEDKIKKVIQTHFDRGRIEVYINIAGDGITRKKIQTDWTLMDQYINQLKHAKSRYDLSGSIPVSIMSTLPEIVSVQEIEDHPSELEGAVIKSVHHTCEQVLTMRKEEGKFLLNDMNERMTVVQDTISRLKTRRNYVIEEYRERIQSRVKDHISENVTIDDGRLHQEIAILAEKGDITEEITRLMSHIEHFFELVQFDEAIGRKLDFILQEMHREANTIGSKSTDAKVGNWIVSLKSDLEKIKEQIQNIE